MIHLQKHEKYNKIQLNNYDSNRRDHYVYTNVAMYQSDLLELAIVLSMLDGILSSHDDTESNEIEMRKIALENWLDTTSLMFTDLSNLIQCYNKIHPTVVLSIAIVERPSVFDITENEKIAYIYLEFDNVESATLFQLANN